MSSSAFVNRPELALRRAMELQGIQQHDAALVLLHDVLSNRRLRTWSLGLEQVMMAYLQLCIATNKAREAKDGLHQYRNLSQTQAPGSLEKVVRYLMDQAELKCTKAKALADRMAAAESAVDDDLDIDGGEMSSAMWLASLSTDPSAQRRDAVLLLPALKFLWETYRAVLDILRSNSKLEHVYHAAAMGALRFCRDYQRRNEFRRLCDMLRVHFGLLQKYGNIAPVDGEDVKPNNKVRGWEGWTIEAVELHLQTRFAQLDTASTLHLYTEGFRTVEDIYNILQISHERRKVDPTVPPPKAKLMATYYEKLSTLFWVSENYLFHAFAAYKYYALRKEFNKTMSSETAMEQASAVLLAALCIPSSKKIKSLLGSSGTAQFKQADIHDSVMEDPDDSQAQIEKRARMATLLGFQTRNPSRESLLEDIQNRNLLSQVPPYLQSLYQLLEEDSDPLMLVSTATPFLAELEKSALLAQYVPQLRSVILLKLLMKLADCYQTVSMAQWEKLVSGLGMSLEQVEKQVVLFASSHSSHLSVKIDHRAGCLRFGGFAKPRVNSMQSQLSMLAAQLDNVCAALTANEPNTKAAAAQRAAARAAVYAALRAEGMEEHAAVLERKMNIEKRKEEAERLAQEKARQAEALKKREEAMRKAEEERRIAHELQLREKEKQRKIEEEMENRRKVQLLQAMGRKTDGLTDDQLSQMSADKLQKEHLEQQQKKKDEADRKTREVAKRLDYLVRAVRIEELSIIRTRYEEKVAKERQHYEEVTKEKAKRAKQVWEEEKIAKEKLRKLDAYVNAVKFQEKVMETRRLQHIVLCEEADKQAEIDAERAKMDRARKRKIAEEKRQAAEEERIRREEEERIAAEEQRKKEEAKRQKQLEEEERRKAEAARMEEERQRRDKETASRGRGGGSSLSQMSGRGGGGGRYMPPSRRDEGDQRGRGGGGNRYVPPGGGGGSRFPDSGGNRYAGGGRYEGRRDNRDDRRGGYGDNRDDRRGGYGGDRDDRRGGYGDNRDDRRGGYGGDRDDRRGGYGDNRDDRRGGYGGDRDRDDRRGGSSGGGGGWRR